MNTKQKTPLAVMELAYAISQMIESGKIKFADISDREQFDHLFRMALYRQVEQMQEAYIAPYEAYNTPHDDANFTNYLSKNFDV